MTTNRRSEHLRYRYGICLNDNCQKCKNKEVQQISARKDFVCEECGKNLRECPPPKSNSHKAIIVAAVAAVCVAGIGSFWAFSDKETSKLSPTDSLETQSDSLTSPQTIDTITVVKTDTILKTDTIVVKEQVSANKNTAKNAQPTPSSKSNGSVRLSYGNYSGSTLSGKPHGQGRMTFTSSHVIDSRDSKGRVAEAGDYIIGEWNNGNLVQGRWYGTDGNIKGSIIIGM